MSAVVTIDSPRAERPAPRRSESLVVLTNRPPPMPTTESDQGSSGGVMAALNPVMCRRRGSWISGAPVSEPIEPEDTVLTVAARDRTSASPYRSISARYPAELFEGFYNGLSNRVLWPLYHSMLDNVALYRHEQWRDYMRVNRHFAETAVTACEPGDFVWVHDYQLSLVPQMLRDRGPRGLRSGFYLHIPFPPFEIFQTLPWAEKILRGMLGADLIGFHTQDYLDRFLDAVERLLAVPCDRARGEIALGDRTVRVRAIPVGIDTSAIYDVIDQPETHDRAGALRARLGVDHLMLGVDRLDYTKGIDRRLHAFDLLLEKNPALRGKVSLMQVAVPSRTDIASYRALRAELEQLVGGINGRWGTPGWTPVQFLCRSFPLNELTVLYLAADVALVTPLRDGMNLVAKEYCAAHRNNTGVLVLSEFAGAADELTEAVIVNPYDVEGMAKSIDQALVMGKNEAAQRMRALNEKVALRDTNYWVNTFLEEAQAIGWGGGGS